MNLWRNFVCLAAFTKRNCSKSHIFTAGNDPGVQKISSGEKAERNTLFIFAFLLALELTTAFPG